MIEGYKGKAKVYVATFKSSVKIINGFVKISEGSVKTIHGLLSEEMIETVVRTNEVSLKTI